MVNLIKAVLDTEVKTMENKCTFCDKEITNGDGIYIDEIAIDDVFCNNSVCVEAHICKYVATVDSEAKE